MYFSLKKKKNPMPFANRYNKHFNRFETNFNRERSSMAELNASISTHGLFIEMHMVQLTLPQ